VQLARRAGVSEQTLDRWHDEFISSGRAQLAGRGVKARQEHAGERLEAELAERDQMIGGLTVANRILKRAA
jgi:hypothetical protein